MVSSYCCCFFGSVLFPLCKEILIQKERRERMERSYGRQSRGEVRYPHIVLNALGQCYSSASVEVGNTRVVCAVHHPQQLVDEYRGNRGRIACTVRRSARAGQSVFASNAVVTSEKDMALALEGVADQVVVLENIPQLLVELVVEILSDDGGLWDAVTTAMCAALISGGFDLYDVFSACSSALLPDGAVVVDPDETEELKAKATAVVCATLNSGNICYVAHRGCCEPATVSQLVTSALNGALARKDVIAEQIKEETLL